jgi:membrane protein DedA with SNARE-associated domain
MNTIVEFIMRHGYAVLFGALFAHQIGFPVPGPLFLLAAGALAASGKLGLAVSLCLAVIACVLADWLWFEAGRLRDAADRKARKTFAQYGPPILVLCKFVPGLDAVAPPLAGTSGTSRLRFLTLETAGAGLYSGVYSGLGYYFSHDLERVATYAVRAGTLLGGLLFGVVAIYGVRKLVQRNRSIRESELARNTPARLA